MPQSDLRQFCNEVGSITIDSNNLSSRSFDCIGNPRLLKSWKLGLLCSIKAPGKIILEACRWAKELRDNGITVMSGFHSPVEQDVLRILLKGDQPIIFCPARSIENMRIPSQLKKPLKDGRLLIISPFGAKANRTTAKNAKKRNEMIAAISDALFVLHAASGGKTESLAQAVLKSGKKVYTLDNERNQNLLSAGAMLLGRICPDKNPDTDRD